MDARLYDIIRHKSKNIDKLVRANYAGSYLNNTKWYKLIEMLTIEQITRTEEIPMKRKDEETIAFIWWREFDNFLDDLFK